MRTPNALLWIRYAVTGALPSEYADWVLHDTTAPTWLVRHLGRVLMLLALPEVVLVVVLPTGAGIRALTAFVTGACVVLLMSILASDMTERRVQRAGYPWGTAERLRAQHSIEAQQRSAQRHRERIARRRSG